MLTTSCLISIQIKGFNNDYKRLTDSQKQNVVFVEEEEKICNLLQDSTKIYAVNGKQLRECLKDNDTSVVYMWGPNCSAEHCILISACQDYCNKHNYKLFVVADYYDMEPMNAQNVAVEPILIANHFYYDRLYANTLRRLFLEDLLQYQPSKEETGWCRFMLFKGDQLIEYRSNLYDM